MKILQFINSTVRACLAVPRTLKKGLRKITGILSPRTVPSTLTVVVKGSLGYIMIQTANFLKSLNPPASNPANSQAISVTNNGYFIQPPSFEEFLEKMGSTLIIDGAVDTLKIGGMLISRHQRLGAKSKELSTVEIEMKEIDEALQGTQHESDNTKPKLSKQDILELKEKHDELTEKHKLLTSYLQNPANLSINSEDYWAIMRNTEFVQPVFEFFIFAQSNDVVTWINHQLDLYGSNMKEVDQLMTENLYPNETTNFARSSIFMSLYFVTTYYDYHSRQDAIESQSFGNIPILGTTNAIATLYSNVGKVNRYYNLQHPRPELIGYKKISDAIYNNEFNRVYHSNLGTYSNVNTRELAEKLAKGKVSEFHNEVVRRGSFIISCKDVSTRLAKVTNYYGIFKLYKNGLTITENILDLLDRLPEMLPNRAPDMPPEEEPRVMEMDPKARKFRAKALLHRHSKIRPVRLKATRDAQNDAEPRSACATQRRNTTTDLYNSLTTFNQTQCASQSGSGTSNFYDSPHDKSKNDSHLDEPIKDKVKTKGTPSTASPLLFSNGGDSKLNSDTHSAADDKEKDEKLKTKKAILSHYRKCDRTLFRSILDKTAKRVSKERVLNLAQNLHLTTNRTTNGAKIEVYKEQGGSFHRLHGDTDPGFITDLAKAFAFIDISIDDLDSLDREIAIDCCGGFLSSIDYVFTTRPRISSKL